jgi:hemoglobin-like flavoprotein
MSDRALDQGNEDAASPTLLVTASFQKILPNAEAVADLFYSRLFLLNPSLLPMFKGDLRQQGAKLMQVLHVAVKSLDRLDQILPVVRALGERHAGYGVKDEHYDTVRSALLWTLQQELGDEFSPSVAAAWADVYDRLAGVMKAAAASAAAPASLSQRPPAPRSVRPSASLSQPPPA